ncbi:phytanoyl-CoA dioxygenase family protein [Calothrix sp. NIES-2100]|uniref:phytanoyl-CoA dioxygenase family protein n=1 Tax=Calothrix sp. NIES-2100 TaxID=1954172 RepID=UPI0030DBA2CE
MAIYQGDDKYIGDLTIEHNLQGLENFVISPRILILIKPLSVLGKVNPNSNLFGILNPSSKILVIGPRSEDDLLCLIGHGFEIENIRGLDLISYSPWVDIGDMHSMPYEDDSWDAIILGWVLNYSNNPKQVADEVIRVAKPGCLVAIGVEYNPLTDEQITEIYGYAPGGSRSNSVDEILAYFGDSVDQVYYQHDIKSVVGDDKNSELAVIFSISKKNSQKNEQAQTELLNNEAEDNTDYEEYCLKLLNITFNLENIDKYDVSEAEKSLRKKTYFQEIFSEVVKDWAVNEKIPLLVEREQFLNIIDVFNRGYEHFIKNSQTPPQSYQAMRLLYFLTDGAFNNFWMSLYSLFYLPYDLNTAKEFLMPSSQSQAESIAKEIQEQGYYVFEDKVSSEICDRLLDFAYSMPCNINIHNPSQPEYAIYQKEQPKAPTYHIDETKLIENPIIQDFISDRFLLEVAQSYCGSCVTNRNTSMWWSTSILNGEASSRDAQLYHWDGDPIKFLNFFIYLTDVDTNNGPHCFVKGSHLTKPISLLRDGRFLDEEIEQYYEQDKIIEITGSRGTIIAADTRGFHKGKALKSGHRLIFQVTMATCLFGAPYNSIELNIKTVKPSFLEAYKNFPYTYQRWQILH